MAIVTGRGPSRWRASWLIGCAGLVASSPVLLVEVILLLISMPLSFLLSLVLLEMSSPALLFGLWVGLLWLLLVSWTKCVLLTDATVPPIQISEQPPRHLGRFHCTERASDKRKQQSVDLKKASRDPWHPGTTITEKLHSRRFVP